MGRWLLARHEHAPGNGAGTTLPRTDNYIWAQLAEPSLTAGLIAVGHHLPCQPDEFIRLKDRGSLEVGQRADIIALEPDLGICQAYVAGERMLPQGS